MRSTAKWLGLAALILGFVAMWGAPVHEDVVVAQEKDGVPVVWMYGDANGETHLKDIMVDLSPFMGIRGQKRDKPGTDAASEVIESSGVQFRRGGTAQNHGPRTGDWRKAEERPGQYIVILKGQLEVETTDGSKRVLGPGQVLLEDDSYSKGHHSRAVTPERHQLFIPLKTAFKRPPV